MDLFLLSCFSVHSVSVFEADPDLSNEGTDLFLPSSFSVFSVTVFESDPDLSYEVTLVCAIVCSWLLSSVESTKGILEDTILYFELFCLF